MKTITEKLLSKFPKTRPSLPEAQQAIYEQEYSVNRDGANFISNLAQKMEGWMHCQIAKNTKGKNILELGAGNLNHLRYINFSEIESYDAIEPMEFLYRNSANKNKVNHFYKDIKECNKKYDTILSIAVLEHITDLPDAIKKAASLLNDNGIFVNAIPCEGGMLWGAAWRLSTGLSYKLRTGMTYKNVMRHEHINNHDEIIALVKHFFSDVKISYNFIPQKHLSLYASVVAKNPRNIS